MISTDLYLFDDNTSKARGLCLLENTPASEDRPAGDWRWDMQLLTALTKVSTLQGRPVGDWWREAGGGLMSEDRPAGVPRPNRPAVAARPCASLEWIRHGWREGEDEVGRNGSHVFEESLEPTFSISILTQNQPNRRAFWTKRGLLWVEPVQTYINPLTKHTP